jgi:hypothetical protein
METDSSKIQISKPRPKNAEKINSSKDQKMQRKLTAQETKK